MNTRTSRQDLAQKLRLAAARYQAEAVIPHCPSCAKPCCGLSALVLEMEWKQIKFLWKREESRTQFDQLLAAQQGPVEIRTANGLYYVHSKPCPAFDQAGVGCRVYDQPLKPAGCTDFPVYEDGTTITADLRCEAVKLDELIPVIAEAVEGAYQIGQSADRDFPFLVTLSVNKTKLAQQSKASGKPKRR